MRGVDGSSTSRVQTELSAGAAGGDPLDRPRGPVGRGGGRPRGSVPFPSAGHRGLPGGGPPPQGGRLRRLHLPDPCTGSASTPPPTSSSPASWTSSWGPNYLVTHHDGPMRSITAARDLCSKNLQAAMPQGRRLPAPPDPGPDVRALLPEPRPHRGQDPARAGRGVREPHPGDPRPDLRPEARRDAAPAHLHAPARDHPPPVARRVQGHQRPKPRSTSATSTTTSTGIVDASYSLPGHDAGHPRRLPLGRQQPAQRDHEAPHGDRRDPGLADGDHAASTG